MADQTKTGAELIAKERARQVSAEGYDAEHDDCHGDGELAWAAVCYAAPERVYRMGTQDRSIVFGDPWPWDEDDDRRTFMGDEPFDNCELPDADRIDLLVKAGSLIAAEIDRLKREQERSQDG